MRVAVLFDNFGPYHLARLRAAASVCELLALEVAADSAEYAWKSGWDDGSLADGEKQKVESRDSSRGQRNWKIVTLQQTGTSRDATQPELMRKLAETLENFNPQVVFVPGWSSKAAFAALDWCIQHQVPRVVMSESTEWDEKRAGWKEWVKREIVSLYSCALVGGRPHKDYMSQLGMGIDRIFTGYDAVDNHYFSAKAEESRKHKEESRNQDGLPENYFLASARFIEKKNLTRLIEAYGRYREEAEGKIESRKQKAEIEEEKSWNPSPSAAQASQSEGIQNQNKSQLSAFPISAFPPWSLVLLGDGPLRETLNAQLSTLNLHSYVQMPGFRQYPDLPAYYGCAQAFIHASTTEQWGLVVNEAMASGLPVLVSNRCGCASELIQEGVNGFSFDPRNIEEIVRLMLKVSTPGFPLSSFGSASQRAIAGWGPDAFAAGLRAAAEKALEVPPPRASLVQRLLLRGLQFR